MSIVMIGEWGRSEEGIYGYTINTTTKEEIYKIIEEVREAGWKFWNTPNITKKFKTYHVFLQLYKPKELGYPEES